jgi:flavin-dependent dehydrogenase
MDNFFDVAVIGGAFSGAATALLLKREHPQLRVLIVEKCEEFDRKVGESTTEVSSCFLTRVLGLTNYLGHHQLPKQGLRMWFAKSPEQPFEECVEIGTRYNSRLPGFQVDRAHLDSHVLDLAVSAGCELWRPAKITGVEAGGAGKNVLHVTKNGETHMVNAKWVIDASGRAAFLSRKLHFFKPLDAHPINAIWARFTGVKDWDGLDLRAKHPRYASAVRTSRAWATNHLMGLGWWCWIIPLKGGDYSIGLVYDSRIFTPPAGATLGERLQAHFRAHPVGREILGDARPIEHDQRAYSALAYRSEKITGDGWVIVGDAAGFLDPLYSSGLDYCAFTSRSAATLVARALAGTDVSGEIEKRNTDFAFCFESWFNAVYRDKYYYMGDAELMSAAFLLDISAYIAGPARDVYNNTEQNFDFFPFRGLPGRVVAVLMSWYNRRLCKLAKRKIAAGCYGDRNANWRMMLAGFVPDKSLGRYFLRGVFRWWRAELRNLFLRPVLRRHPVATPEDARMAA